MDDRELLDRAEEITERRKDALRDGSLTLGGLGGHYSPDPEASARKLLNGELIDLDLVGPIIDARVQGMIDSAAQGIPFSALVAGLWIDSFLLGVVFGRVREEAKHG